MVSLAPPIAEATRTNAARIPMPARNDHPDAAYVEDILERHAPFGAVSSRFMFGGFGLYVDGVMFALVDDATLYLRADEVTRPDFEAIGSQPWVYEAGGKRTTMSYYRIPEDDFDNTEALRAWFESARGAALRTAAAKKPRRKKTTSQ
jgi:DNA transformation protein